MRSVTVCGLTNAGSYFSATWLSLCDAVTSLTPASVPRARLTAF